MRGGSPSHPQFPEDNPGAPHVFEKQKLRLPQGFAIVIFICFSVFWVYEICNFLAPATEDMIMAASYDGHWPQAEAKFTDPLVLYVTTPSQKIQMMLTTFRFQYVVADNAPRFSDRFEIGEVSGLELDKEDKRLPKFLAKYCAAPKVQKESLATLYTYEKCKAFKAEYNPRYPRYAVLLPPRDIDKLRTETKSAFIDALISCAINAACIWLLWLYLRRSKK